MSLDRGFTLIEITIVLFVIGLLSSLVILGIAPNRAALADQEARRLAALFELAFAEARGTGQALAWSPEYNGYSFWHQTEDGDWVRFPVTSVYRRRTLADLVTLESVSLGARKIRVDERIPFAPHGLHDPIEATIRGGDVQLILRGGVLGRISLERGPTADSRFHTN